MRSRTVYLRIVLCGDAVRIPRGAAYAGGCLRESPAALPHLLYCVQRLVIFRLACLGFHASPAPGRPLSANLVAAAANRQSFQPTDHSGSEPPRSDVSSDRSYPEEIMAWRKTGLFRPADEILVLTCDVCERDIGYEDGRRPQEHFRVSRHPNPGSIGDQEPDTALCSRECLRAFAANTPGPERSTVSASGERPPGKPKAVR